MNKPKVFLTGGDNIGWALDDDLSQLGRALSGQVDFVGLDQCEVVHSVWWETLLALPEASLAGKRVVCQASGEPYRYMTLPAFQKALSLVGRWVAQSSQAKKQFDESGIASNLVPYAVDTDIFRPLGKNHPEVAALRSQWNIPGDRYLIGNFHRDTEGCDLESPKLAKGPDIFAEIVRCLHVSGTPVHVVLAGPRRFWLRHYLGQRGIPFTYVGEIVATDDMKINRLPRESLNLLYNLIDLYVVSSRSEGGPRSLLEAAAASCKVISTPTGLAEDILVPECIYRDPSEAVELIRRDVESNLLGHSVAAHRASILENHVGAAARSLLADFYKEIETVPKCAIESPAAEQTTFPRDNILNRIKGTFAKRADRGQPLTAGIWHKFVEPPFGGGNQFMLALRKGLALNGVKIIENKIDKSVSAYVLNSIWFDVESFRKHKINNKIKILHRIDGPIALIRGEGGQLDDLCFQINKELASATVMQSAWTYRKSLELGYRPVRPVIIHNAVDPDIFNRIGRIRFSQNRKIRLISSSWSDNPRKGGPIYKWIEDNLDWDRFEYTFVGRASASFDRIRQVKPVPSSELADILRQHDIFIAASQNDPCSNAVIEALACGLPVLYLNDGGHPELVGYGGLPFSDRHEIFPQLDRLVENYEIFQNLIAVPTLEDVAGKYLALLKNISGYV